MPAPVLYQREGENKITLCGMVNERALLELAAVAPSNHRWPGEQTEGDRGKRHHLLASFPLFLSPSPLLAFTELYAGVPCELGIAASEKGQKGQVISQENPQLFSRLPGNHF